MSKATKLKKVPECRRCKVAGLGKVPKSFNIDCGDSRGTGKSECRHHFVSEAVVEEIDRHRSVDAEVLLELSHRREIGQLVALGVAVPDEIRDISVAHENGRSDLGTAAWLVSAYQTRFAVKVTIERLLYGLDAFADEQLRIFTISDHRWVMPIEWLGAFRPKEIWRRFLAELTFHGIAQRPGFLVGFIQGEFDPVTCTHRFRIEGVGSARKVEALKALEGLSPGFERRDDTVVCPIVVENVTDRVQQLCDMVDVELVRKKLDPVTGVDEGWFGPGAARSNDVHMLHTVAWLGRRRFADLTISHGCRFHPCGHFKVANEALLVQGEPQGHRGLEAERKFREDKAVRLAAARGRDKAARREAKNLYFTDDYDR